MTRLSTNGRLSYTPVHRETPIEGIGGMYRFWKSIDSKDRDKLVELFEFGHQNPGEDTPDTSRMDWQSLAEQQKDAYENGYPGPVELMSQGWDHAIDDALNRKVQSATDRLANQTRDLETSNSPETGYDYKAAEDVLAKMSEDADRAHAQAYDWRAGNDDRWRMPRLTDSAGNRLEWPTVNTFIPDEYSEALNRAGQVSQGHMRRLY